MEDRAELSDALRAIYDRNQARGLKKIQIRPSGGDLDILVEASAARFAEHLAGLTKDGAGGCAIMIQVDGKVLMDDSDEAALTVWNAGNGGPHAEARARTALLNLRDSGQLPRNANLIEVWIRYSPCRDRCSFVLDNIEREIKSTHQLVEFKWYFQDLYGKPSKAISQRVVDAYGQRGIFIMQFSEALKAEQIP